MAQRSRVPRAATAAAFVGLATAWWGILRTGSPTLAFAFFLASRTCYVSFTGLALRAQDESGWWTRRWGAVEGFCRFRLVTALFMYNDAVSIGLVCWTTRGTLLSGLPEWFLASLGGALVVLGLGVKGWAVATLGSDSFYWRSFFVPASRTRFVVSGPYRWFANPMYTVGYVQAYGMALCLRSWPGLIASAVAHSLILVLNHWAEKPHTERIRLRAAAAGSAE